MLQMPLLVNFHTTDEEVEQLLRELPAAPVGHLQPQGRAEGAPDDALEREAGSRLCGPAAVGITTGRVLLQLPEGRRDGFRESMRELASGGRSVPAALFGEVYRAARDSATLSHAGLVSRYGAQVDPFALAIVAGCSASAPGATPARAADAPAELNSKATSAPRPQPGIVEGVAWPQNSEMPYAMAMAASEQLPGTRASAAENSLVANEQIRLRGAVSSRQPWAQPTPGSLRRRAATLTKRPNEAAQAWAKKVDFSAMAGLTPHVAQEAMAHFLAKAENLVRAKPSAEMWDFRINITAGRKSRYPTEIAHCVFRTQLASQLPQYLASQKLPSAQSAGVITRAELTVTVVDPAQLGTGRDIRLEGDRDFGETPLWRVYVSLRRRPFSYARPSRFG